MMTQIKAILILLTTTIGLCFFLSACTTSKNSANAPDGIPYGNVDVSKIPNAVPKNEPKCAYGNPPSYVAAGHRYFVLNNSQGYSKKGVASWYGRKFQNQMTSSHERYDPWAMTAASKDLPIPTYVKVTNLTNGRQVIVKVNDRGPFTSNRLIDLSYAAASKLGYTGSGTALVQVSSINVDQFYNAANQTRKVNKTIPAHEVLASASTTKAHTSPNSYHKTVTSHPQLYVQVGAFEAYNTAKQIKLSLNNLTQYTTRIAPIAAAGQTVYRVQIGPLQSTQQSNELFKTLRQHGFHRTITVLG